jgi:serine/threonine-protein kinase HipA
MAFDTGATSPSVFDLLARVGADVAGGLVLSAEQVPPEPAPEGDLVPASDDEIAFRIHELRRDPDRWIDPQARRGRYSLAGAQAKFALARLDSDWYWSSAGLPSTHIFKPAPDDLREAEILEAATLRLARAIGVTASRGGTIEVLGQSSYIVERFDRDTATFPFARIHTEDFAQAMGLPRSRKYGVTAVQAIGLLRRFDPTDSTAYAFIRQLAFNVAIGNADAHAKNYSLFIRPHGIWLTPLYDAIPTAYWPWLDSKLAMAIGGGQRSPEIGPPHWRKLARRTGLDPDRVTIIATTTADRVLALSPEIYAGAPAKVREQLLSTLAHANTTMTKPRRALKPDRDH